MLQCHRECDLNNNFTYLYPTTQLSESHKTIAQGKSSSKVHFLKAIIDLEVQVWIISDIYCLRAVLSRPEKNFSLTAKRLEC